MRRCLYIMVEEGLHKPTGGSHVEALFSQDSRYEAMFAEVTPYLLAGRPYNYIHTLWGLGDIYFLALHEKQEDLLKVLVGAFMFHDAGWPLVPNVQTDPTVWSSLEGRVLHMQAGSGLAGRILPKYGYTPEEIAQVRDIIEHHDDVYLVGKPLESEILRSHRIHLPDTAAGKMHRDADAHFIFSPYFWKDWWTRYRDRGLSPADTLLTQIQKYGKMYTEGGMVLVGSDILGRSMEIEEGDGAFERYYRKTEEINALTKELVGQGKPPLFILQAVNSLLHDRK